MTSMPPAARAGGWLGAGGRSRHLERNTGRVSRRITYQHLRSWRGTDGSGRKADGGTDTTTVRLLPARRAGPGDRARDLAARDASRRSLGQASSSRPASCHQTRSQSRALATLASLRNGAYAPPWSAILIGKILGAHREDEDESLRCPSLPAPGWDVPATARRPRGTLLASRDSRWAV